MTNETTVPAESIRASLERYQPRVLSPALSKIYLEDLKVLVMLTEPASALDARHQIGAFGRYLSDIKPADGETLADLFTEARLARWMNGQKLSGRSIGSLQTAQGRLRRAIRVLGGLPAHCRKRQPQTLALPPLSDDDLVRLIASAATSGDAAVRGLVVAIGCGIVGAPGVGGRISADSQRADLVVLDGTARRVLPQLTKAARSVDGQVVCDGDWEAIREAGVTAVVALNNERARQTYRWLALRLDAPVAALMRTYMLTYDSIVGILPYIGLQPSLPDDQLFELLRGPIAGIDEAGTLSAMVTKVESRPS